MKKQATKYKYFKTLFDSIKITFKNPRLLIPYLIMFLSMAIFSSAIDWLGKSLETSILAGQGIMPLAICSLTMMVLFLALSFILTGWAFSALNQYMHTDKFSLKSAFKRSFSFAGRFFLVSLIAALVPAIIYLLVYAASLAFSALGAPILSLILGAIFIVFVIIYATLFVQSTPVLIVEDKGTIETIKRTISFYLKKKLYSLNILLVALLFGCVIALPSIAYMLYVLFTQTPFLGVIRTADYTTTQKLILCLLELPIYLGSAATVAYYCISYKIKKATIKEK